MPQFDKESIPPACRVFYRLHQTFFNKKSELNPAVFQDRDGGMSVDWGKYSTPKQTQMRARKNPAHNKIGVLNVEGIRMIDSLTVEHTPDELTLNQAHADVLGEKTEKVQLALWDLCKDNILSIP